MVEQLPVKRQLPGVIRVVKRGEFGETLTDYSAGNPEPSFSHYIVKKYRERKRCRDYPEKE